MNFSKTVGRKIKTNKQITTWFSFIPILDVSTKPQQFLSLNDCASNTVLWFSFDSLKGLFYEPHCDGSYFWRSSRGMTVYSAEFPFSLGLSLGRKVSISCSLCWFEELLETTVRVSWSARFHLCIKEQQELNSVLKEAPVTCFVRFSDIWDLLVSGGNGDAEHYKCCNANNKAKNNDPIWTYGRVCVIKAEWLKSEY